MGAHPLIERSRQRDVRQSKGFREAAAKLSGEILVPEWEQEKAAAPRRGDAGRKYLVAPNARLAGARRPGRDGEHAAIALAAWARDHGPLPLPDERGGFLPLHPAVPLRAAAPDPARGGDDPNAGAARIDLLGLGPDDRLAVATLRFLAPGAGRVGTGDTPLRALLEGLAAAAVAASNREALAAELASRTDRTVADAPPALLVIGSPRYWELCRKREAQRGAAWIREIERLAGEIEAALGVPVLLLSLRLEGDPGFEYASGAPRLEKPPRLVPAFEPGAGRLRPKPRPRRRKEVGTPAETVAEADLSRPIRRYASNERYSRGDRIEHPTLGLGVVQGDAGPNKIRVHFGERKSTLVHDR